MAPPQGLLVDAIPGLFPAGGIGRYVRDLSDALALPGAPPARFSHTRDLRGMARSRYRTETLFELPISRGHLNLLIALGVRLGATFDQLYGRPAVFHSTLGCGPTFAHARLISHVHDLATLEHPDWFPPRTRWFLRATMPVAARRADVVLTHSRFVRDRVIEVFGVEPARIKTIPPPLSRGFEPMELSAARARVVRRFGLTAPFVLHVGTLEPRKNHVRLIGAFERLRRAGFPGRLVLAGQMGWHTGPILARLERSPERSSIQRVTDADNLDLVALYQTSTSVAFPSLEEGFGMPLLESMACGAACVISDHPALLELGSGCALTVPATDEEALAEVLIALWRDPDLRARTAAGGPARASGYRFEPWAKRILALYRGELERAAGIISTPHELPELPGT